MPVPSDPLAYLRRLRDAGNHNDVVQMIRDRDSVIRRYGPVFADPAVLTADTLAGFLLFENNRHWWGLHRRAEPLTRRIEAVRAMIAELLDAERPIAARIDGLGEPSEFDRDVWSPILLVTHPDTYGVWNAISESAMRRLGLWPTGTSDRSTGETYAAANATLNLMCAELDIDLWTLDALWWAAEKEHDPTRHFVTRGTHARPPRTQPATARTRTLRTAKTRIAAGEDTFVCQSCWTTKLTRLASDMPGYCIDCA